MAAAIVHGLWHCAATAPRETKTWVTPSVYGSPHVVCPCHDEWCMYGRCTTSLTFAASLRQTRGRCRDSATALRSFIMVLGLVGRCDWRWRRHMFTCPSVPPARPQLPPSPLQGSAGQPDQELHGHLQQPGVHEYARRAAGGDDAQHEPKRRGHDHAHTHAQCGRWRICCAGG